MITIGDLNDAMKKIIETMKQHIDQKFEELKKDLDGSKKAPKINQ